MVTVFLDHGDHGHFLTMTLNTLLGDAEEITEQAIFDFWQQRQNKDSFRIRSQYKHLFVPQDYKDRKFIWIVRDDPVLWAYNLCTRAVLGRLANFAEFKKGITIHKFEKDPWKWAPNCDITGLTALDQIKKKPNGDIHKKSFKSWYRKFIFNEYWLKQKTPKGAVVFNMSSFYDLNLFQDSLQTIGSKLNVTFNLHKAESLYKILHKTLSYDKHTAHNDPTVLLETYQMAVS